MIGRVARATLSTRARSPKRLRPGRPLTRPATKVAPADIQVHRPPAPSDFRPRRLAAEAKPAPATAFTSPVGAGRARRSEERNQIRYVFSVNPEVASLNFPHEAGHHRFRHLHRGRHRSHVKTPGDQDSLSLTP